jgi:hypothetical protein
MGAVGPTRAQARAAVGPQADERRRSPKTFRVLRELGVPELADRSTDRALPLCAIARPKPWYCRSYNFVRSARSDIVEVSSKRANPAQRQGRADSRSGSDALVDEPHEVEASEAVSTDLWRERTKGDDSV